MTRNKSYYNAMKKRAIIELKKDIAKDEKKFKTLINKAENDSNHNLKVLDKYSKRIPPKTKLKQVGRTLSKVENVLNRLSTNRKKLRSI